MDTRYSYMPEMRCCKYDEPGFWMRYMYLLKYILLMLIAVSSNTLNAADALDARRPIVIGLSAEFGVNNSVAAQSIEKGILLAINEINSAGGLLGGRKLVIEKRDDRGVPARGIDNLNSLATNKDVVAVFSGRFSPVTLELAPVANRLGILLLAPWSAADSITSQPAPNYVFRLALTDTWAMLKMLDYANSHGFRRIALFIPNTAWGRSCEAAVQAYQKKNSGISRTTFKYNVGETDFRDQLHKAGDYGAQAIILVSNESEGVPLVKQVAEMPKEKRLPIISHWGIAGGDFVKNAGDSLASVDLVVVQTFTFSGNNSAKAKQVSESFRRFFGNDTNTLHAQVGFAHAYDLTHLLARAITKAGSSERSAVRKAMEQSDSYEGLASHYQHPFTSTDHEALDSSQLFLGRFDQYGNVKGFD